MRYAIFVIDSISGSATDDEATAINAFNDSLVANGHWIMAAGLTAPDAAMIIDERGEQVVITPGSIFESTEFLSGFWLIEAKDLETAKRLAAEGSKACNRKVELRPFIR